MEVKASALTLIFGLEVLMCVLLLAWLFLAVDAGG